MLRRPFAEQLQPQQDGDAQCKAGEIKGLEADGRLRRVQPGGTHDNRIERTGHQTENHPNHLAAIFAERGANRVNGKPNACDYPQPQRTESRKHGKIKSKEEAQQFMDHGLDKEEARRVWDVYNKSLFINMTRGIQYLDEIKELVIEGFESALEEGPVANEIAMGMKFTLVDAKLHEDAVHRGPAQILPAIRNAIKGGMMMADPTLLEPVQKVFINTPTDYMGSCTKEILNRRGQIIDMPTEGDMVNIEAKVPVAEMFGFAGDIRSATQGRCLWSTENSGFERLPRELQSQIIRQIRERKGLSPEPFGPDHYLG